MIINRDKLLHKYGEFLYDLDHCNDYFQKLIIIRQMNVINSLLGLPNVKYGSTLSEIVKKISHEDIRPNIH